MANTMKQGVFLLPNDCIKNQVFATLIGNSREWATSESQPHNLEFSPHFVPVISFQSVNHSRAK